MKKFMKAIAFVTVMCMVLSTVAFANEAAKSDTDDKTVIVTVTTAGTNDQVALMVVEATGTTPNRDFSNPLYVDQKGAEDGAATFTAKIDADVNAVDVFVGYANNGDNPAVHVGKVDLVDVITEVTVVMADSGFVQGDNLKAQEQTGAGVWGEFTVKAPDEVEASQMIWAIRYTDEKGDPQVKYSDAIDVADYHIGNMLAGSIKLGLAFLNGSVLNEINSVTITGVDAIFLFVGEDFEDQEVLTNPTEDSGNKKPEVATN